MRTHRAALDALAALAFLAAPADALFVETPLVLTAEAHHGEVGDDLAFDVGTDNETARAEWRGRTVLARYGYDPQEGRDRSAEDDAPAEWVKRDIATFTLDERASGSFTWTVPAEADDRNLVVTVETEDGTILAVTDVGVGDAPAVMRMTGGAGGEPLAQDQPDEPPKDAPGAGLLAVAAAALAVAALRRKTE